MYSEKPLAPTVAEVDRIARAAETHALVVVAAPSVLLFPQVRRALELVQTGALGKIHLARGQALGGIPPWEGYLSDPTPFFAQLGGPLSDMAVYPLHALTGLLGPVRRVTALAARTRDPMRIPNICCAVLLILSGGILFNLFALLLVTGEYNHDYPQAGITLALGAASGLFGFIGGVFALCYTISKRR